MTVSTRGRVEIGIGAAFSALACIAVLFRFVARRKSRVRLEVDDYLAIASLTFIIALVIELCLWATMGSSGKHFSELTVPQSKLFFKIFLANEFTYGTTSPLVKLTLLAFYRRLFPIKRFRICADIVAALCLGWGISVIVVAGVQCMPLQRFWDRSVPGQCINPVAFVQGIQGINIFLDLCILLLPMPMVWNLKRPWQDKLALSCVFLLGAFAVAASCVRMWALTIISARDISYTTYQGVIWTFVEPCIGLTCACLPIIRGLFPSFAVKNSRYSKTATKNSSKHRSVVSEFSEQPSTDNTRYIEIPDMGRRQSSIKHGGGSGDGGVGGGGDESLNSARDGSESEADRIPVIKDLDLAT